MPTGTEVAPSGLAELDRLVAAVEATAIVMWRGEPIPFARVPERVADLGGRAERDALYGAYREALEALNAIYERRLEAWLGSGDLVDAAARNGPDPRGLAGDLERFNLHSETVYYAALRRYLALIDIEQGDGTLADLWHVVRGAASAQWFGPRDVARAVAATGRPSSEPAAGTGWRGAEQMLGGAATGSEATPIPGAVRAAYAALVGSPEWLGEELRVNAAEVPSLVDFVAFARLARMRDAIGRLMYELRVFGEEGDAATRRAYYAGLVGHMLGVIVPEEGYLRALPAPFASVRELETTLLGAQLGEIVEARFGPAWWRDRAAAELIERFASAPSVDDALAHLGYDALDWRPVLRQIRTRLIGEMSGYGGPNITTRAGTRKV